MKIVAALLSITFAVLIAFNWYQEHAFYFPNKNELVNDADVTEYLQKFELSDELHERIPTGIYVDSMHFNSANDVHIGGYVWQEFTSEQLEMHHEGVIFTDAVELATMEEAYCNIVDGKTIIGWYFEANLRQDFSYKDYPIDHKTVWIKILPKDFNSNLVLVPSLKSYSDTSLKSSFGLASDMVLEGWSVNETFFDFMPVEFNTNFGLASNHVRTIVPELTFNVVLKRDFFSAFLVNITLLIVCMSLLFSLVMMMTSNSALKEKYDLSVSGSIGTCAGIFFVVLIAHISLREKFPSSGIVYLEYFYLVAYVYILMIALSNYFFNTKTELAQRGLFAKDAYLLKLLYWPVYFGSLLFITWLNFK